MAAATLLPPLRPIATMAGTPYFSQTAKSRSLLSTTFTNPTGTPMTSAGRSPASIWSAMVSRAVGALPTANTAPGCSCAARCMEATARVVPLALARAATSGVSHVAQGRAAQAGKAGLGDAGQRHVRVGDDGSARPQGLHPGRHGTRGEAQIPGIVKVGGGVDDPLDHGFVLGRRGQAHHFQLFGDDVEARPLNVSGQMMLRRQYSIPFRAFIPFW